MLCKRAIEPCYGLWTLPGGFMENDETTIATAARETREEACAEVNVGQIYTLFNLPHINQVHLFYLAELPEPEFAAGKESLEVHLLGKDEIPWDEIAFPAVRRTLEHFFEDRINGVFPMRVADVLINDQNERLIRPHH
jgi:ADP-ribose pyrophosphatase YjhB (NUDIX family)